jgi:predicted house-cleaning NTP pyrophosphatase (Maf/HAM1 superfamily)
VQPLPTDMILQHLPSLSNKRIVLASASPRRKELLSALGIKFEVWGSDTPHYQHASALSCH